MQTCISIVCPNVCPGAASRIPVNSVDGPLLTDLLADGAMCRVGGAASTEGS